MIGFNVINFDYEVLKPYSPSENFRAFRSTDMLLDISRTLNFRLKLDSIAKATLGSAKIADGVQSVEWFKDGELEKVAEYCKADVDITRRVYEFGRENGFVYFYSKYYTQTNANKLRCLVHWS